MSQIAYIPGQIPEKQALLARYLPPLPKGTAATWLQDNIAPGSWILDPFGASPLTPIEIAQSGYRVLVTANNPVARFLIEFHANPPSETELRNALANLAASRKGEERLEPHIKNLYATRCDQCGREISAESYIWERDASTPYGKIYDCPYCGEKGEHSVNRKDEEKAKRFEMGGLNRARALERIAPANDPNRSHAEEALSAYIPRAVYALFTLINKSDTFHSDYSLDSPAAQRLKRNLDALLLSACDKANTLWSYPTARERPKQLTVPPRYRERNIWLALEEAVDQLSSNSTSVPVTAWPNLPSNDVGVVVFEGRLKDLKDLIRKHQDPKITFEAILAAFPRPNQAFWTLSALWAGWLWGREAVGPFRSVLRRRRYDWIWHTSALHAVLSQLTFLSTRDLPFFGLMAEAEPGFLSAATIAARLAGFKLQGLALRAERNQAQILWRRQLELRRQSSVPDTGKPMEAINSARTTREIVTHFSELASSAVKEYLISRAEPTKYLNLHTVGLSAVINTETFTQSDFTPAEAYEQVQEAFGEAFTFRRGFLRFGGSEKSLEVGQWWLLEKTGVIRDAKPLADRVEQFVSQFLFNNPGCTLLELDTAVCKSMRGLFTSEIELVVECLRSYGKQNLDARTWQLRPQDTPEARHSDLSSLRMSLIKIGKDLGFSVAGENPILWLDVGRVAYAFYLTYSAMFGEFIYSNPYPPFTSLVVYPGGRSNLVIYKLNHDARLKQALDQGWRLVKFRLLRRLAENPLISRDNLDEQLALDPLRDDAPQLRLL